MCLDVFPWLTFPMIIEISWMQRAMLASWWDTLKNRTPIDFLILSNRKLLSDEMYGLMIILMEIICWIPSLDYCRMIPLRLSLTLVLLLHFFSPSTRQSNFVLISTRLSTSESTSLSSFVSIGPLTEYPSTSNQPTAMKCSSPISCLPRWTAKRIEVIGADVRDVSFGWQSWIWKKHASVSLMTHVLENFDHVSYSDA